jgi:hypothetical protein
MSSLGRPDVARPGAASVKEKATRNAALIVIISNHPGAHGSLGNSNRGRAAGPFRNVSAGSDVCLGEGFRLIAPGTHGTGYERSWPNYRWR